MRGKSANSRGKQRRAIARARLFHQRVHPIEQFSEIGTAAFQSRKRAAGNTCQTQFLQRSCKRFGKPRGAGDGREIFERGIVRGLERRASGDRFVSQARCGRIASCRKIGGGQARGTLGERQPMKAERRAPFNRNRPREVIDRSA